MAQPREPHMANDAAGLGRLDKLIDDVEFKHTIRED